MVEIYQDSNLVFIKRYTSSLPWYDKILLQKNSVYKIFCNSVEIHFAYLCGNQDVLDKGVCFLEFGEDGVTKFDDGNMDQAYEQKYRNAFHFCTFKNWMNDPNGLCFYNGRYHLFYQMNPAGLNWGNVYWGHACSKDLVQWIHLPIALYPQRELYGLNNYKGGAYSGSAWPEKQGISLYFTRHFSPWKKGIETKEVQVQAFCEDEVTVKEEKVIIEEKPGGSRDYNFRDPSVVMIGQKKYLLIGTTVGGRCTVEKYGEDQGIWTDLGVFFQDDIECETIECVNFIQGENGQCALLCSLQNAADPAGRKRLMKYYTGVLEDGKFLPKTEGIYDFGTECYAAQAFGAGDRVLSFGWILSAYGEFPADERRLSGGALNGQSASECPTDGYISDSRSSNVGICSGCMASECPSNGCMTIPRELTVDGGYLLTKPAREIKSLLYDRKTIIENGRKINSIPDISNVYHLFLKLKSKTDFRIILAQNESRQIGVEYENSRLTLIYGNKDQHPYPTLYETVDTVRRLEIFVDKSSIELFVNDGRQVGTKTYFFKPYDKSMEYRFEHGEEVEELTVSRIKNIWKKWR
ncbi:GH32 C-terminal domain-containing protein [Clostridium sp. MCC353]|uniref:glycoside hydrolase family 32 protein n=1 Tax=Clostridium sp. MCC353 TaxID=2592646 RepID=UPI001C02C1A4|nr:GH32 C-terminal domain-containing protein [Clostridium sp. MCC353]